MDRASDLLFKGEKFFPVPGNLLLRNRQDRVIILKGERQVTLAEVRRNEGLLPFLNLAYENLPLNFNFFEEGSTKYETMHCE